MLEMLTVDRIIKNALEEDLGWGDVTTDSTIPKGTAIKGFFIAKEQGVVCGIEVCKRVYEIMDDAIAFEILIIDGLMAQKGDVIARISGPARSILKGERVSLNLLQRMSGIATAASKYAEAVQGTIARVVDTRKTMPGLRILDKYSVLTGGCHNHRFNLSDLVLIKDNHIKAAVGITAAVKAAKEKLSHTLKIEVEVESLEQLKEALTAGADIIMLDNMSLEMMREAVQITKGKALLEASGNVALEGNRSVKAIAQTGVDIISVGALTHSVSAMDISLRFV
ncbi:MAG TPA: carboxylating nicotinate-nucleotide diphosphorylase [Methanosarcinales archaeon]|nr:carboxylating nicotinate-nucleotide diphosphorylase [Methanosarcinales archaeon]